MASASSPVVHFAQDAPYERVTDADVMWPDGGSALPWVFDGYGSRVAVDPLSPAGCISSASDEVLAVSALTPSADGEDVFNFLGSLSSDTPPPGDGSSKPHWPASLLAGRGSGNDAKAEQLLPGPAGWGGLPRMPAAPATNAIPAASEPDSPLPPRAPASALQPPADQWQASLAECPTQSSKASPPCPDSFALLRA